ncbi:MAG: GNAT family N-acetyltransferase [Planctomycetaceae bacterium]|nr:GNAT family N-acetyltransferase [Planctomycetaceae bacterium]
MRIEFLKDHPEFIDELNELFYRQWGAIYPEFTKEDWRQRLIARANKKKIPTTLVAVENGVVLGSAALLESDMRTRPELSPWLGGVYVKEEHRHKGIGRTLVAQIEKMAGQLGVLSLYLYTPDKKRFYRQLRWQVLEKTRYQGFDVTIMLKYLSLKE